MPVEQKTLDINQVLAITPTSAITHENVAAVIPLLLEFTQ